MDTKKAIMFLAGLIEKLNIPHSGSTLHGEEWDMLYALKTEISQRLRIKRNRNHEHALLL